MFYLCDFAEQWDPDADVIELAQECFTLCLFHRSVEDLQGGESGSRTRNQNKTV